MISKNPLLNTDIYKFFHMLAYPAKTEIVYETLTPRQNSFFKWSNKMVVFGYFEFVKRLQEDFKENFFDQPLTAVLDEMSDAITQALGDETAQKILPKIAALHNLSYLPIKIDTLPEGVRVPMQVPVLTIENTHPDFYWLPGYLETRLLSETFVSSTVASMAYEFRKLADKYAYITADNNTFVDWQCHDFSKRGQHGSEASVLSGAAHLTSFKGTDVIQAITAVRDNYDTLPSEIIGGSVLATEHSVMEAYGRDQLNAYQSLLDRVPNGILSVVSDTYDYWEVLNEILPKLKDQITNRNGKLVIRPDSDTAPVELTNESIVLTNIGWKPYNNVSEDVILRMPSNRILTKTGFASIHPDEENELVGTTEELIVGSLHSLWSTFGGSYNSKGFKELDVHIGLIHGEGVNLDNFESFLNNVMANHYATNNVVFGVGAYVYSVLVSRDSFGQAIKESSVTIDGVEHMVQKDLKSATESFKKSRKGRVAVTKDESGEYVVTDEFTKANLPENNELTTLFIDGELLKSMSFDLIRQRLLHTK